jgi:hypothetical protein
MAFKIKTPKKKKKERGDNLSWVYEAEEERERNTKERDDFWRTH